MADETDSSAGKKRRVIHWNPDAGREAQKSRWTWPRIALYTFGGVLGLLIVAGGVNRLMRSVFHEIGRAHV